MKAYEFIAWLVSQQGGALAVARAMRRPGFQPSLHKLCAGQVASPKRSSAERIAAHFGIPVDAVYNDALATQLHAKMTGSESRQAAEPLLTYPPTPAPPTWPHARFPESYWQQLDQAERIILEEAMLDCFDKLMARREQLQGVQATRKQLKPAA